MTNNDRNNFAVVFALFLSLFAVPAFSQSGYNEMQSGSVFISIQNAAVPPILGIPTVPNAPPQSIILVRTSDAATTGFNVVVKLRGSSQTTTQYSDKMPAYLYTGFFVAALPSDIESITITEIKTPAQFDFSNPRGRDTAR